MAEALYRKYRPQVFEDVVGQEPIERTLKNAIAQDKVSHAYLFCGPRGTGKTTTARLLAKALLCQSGPTPDPDGTCEDCRLVAEGLHPDVYELDAASRTGVENVREEIISRVQFAPTRGRSKVYIIDEVHMLSVAAFNALLKTLEEPPPHVVFVLCTTDPQKVPETIHSRCQRFDFRRITPESMVSRLGAICIAEDVEFEGEALDLIAHRAEGGLRNALTSLEQIIAFENGKVTLAGAERLLGSIDSNDMAEIVKHVGKRDVASCFRWTASYVETGADLAQFVRDMAERVRNLYVLSLVGDDVDLEINETTRHELIEELQWFGPERLSRLMGVLGDLSSELKTSSNPRLAFEIALTRMVRPDSDLTLEALAERVEALEGGYSAVAHVLPEQPWHNASPNPIEEDKTAGQTFDAEADFAPQPQNPPTVRVHIMGSAKAQPPREIKVTAADFPIQGHGAQPEQSYAPERSSAPKHARADSMDSYGLTQESVSSDTASFAAEAPSDSPDAGKLAMLSNPATVQRVWQAALSAVKKQKQAYGVLFMNAKARFDEDAATLRVVFPAEAAFAYSAVQKPEVQDALANALAHAVGTSVPFTYGRADQPDAPKAQRTPDLQAETQPQRQSAAQSNSAATARHGTMGQHFADGAAAQGSNAASPEAQAAPQETRVAPSEVQAAPPTADMPPYDDLPPYEEIPYEEVPYEDIGYNSAPYDAAPFKASDAPASTPPAQSSAIPDGAQAKGATAVEALLQAGFGGGVIFSEVDN